MLWGDLMKEIYKELIDLEKKYAQMSKNQFINKDEKVTRENVVDTLKASNKELQTIGSKVGAILKEYIYPYIENPALLNSQKADELEEFAENLSNYTNKIDTGLAFDIRDAIAKYSKEINDEERYIRNLFYKGVCLLFLSKAIFHKEMHECYKEIVSFKDKYESFSKDTRNIIIRAFGNCYVSILNDNIYTFYEYVDKAKDFWENVGKKIDPDFRWNAFYANIDENVCSMSTTYLRTCCEAKKEFDKEITNRLYESSQRIYKSILSKEKSPYSYTLEKARYFFLAGEYYKGIIDREEFSDGLYELYIHSKSDSYSSNDIFINLQIPALYLYYFAKIENHKTLIETRTKRVFNVEKGVLKYARNLPIEFPQSEVTGLLSNFATGMHTLYDSFEFLRIALNLTIFRHKPTYAHSLVTAKISRAIAKCLLKENPSFFIGVEGINDINEVEQYLSEIQKFVWFCALAHDVGKIAYTNMVSIYVRKLNDLEFEIIKQHPRSQITVDYERKLEQMALSDKYKDEVMNFTNNESSKFKFINDQKAVEGVVKVSYGHHKSFDGKFGYPKNCDNENSGFKQIIDIVTISDCIDAATDTIGRSYSKGKTLKEVIGEIISEEGSRYSPVIADLLSENLNLYNEIQHIIDVYRYDVYFDCFNEDKFSSDLFANFN